MDNIQTRATLDESLNALTDDLVRVGSRVETAIDQAMRAFSDCDVDLAQQIVVEDAAINASRLEFEETCLNILVTQQPVAVDLRAVLAAMSIIGELERMGDHAAGIARLALRVEEYPKREIPSGLYQIETLCKDMLRRALKAYTERDASLAYAVADDDDHIDSQYRLLFHKVVVETREAEDSTDYLLSLLFAMHNLERIGDRATNIAERVIFMASGKLTELNVGAA